MEPGPEVIKLEYSLKLKIKRNDWLLADTGPQAESVRKQPIIALYFELKSLMKCCSVKSHLNGVLSTGRPWPNSIC